MSRAQSPIIKLRAAHEIALSPKEDRIAFFGDRNIIMLDRFTRQPLFSVNPVAHPSHIDFSPDGHRLAVQGTSGHTVVLDAATGGVLADFDNHRDGEGSAVLFSRCGRYAVSDAVQGSLSVRHAGTSQKVFVCSYDGCALDHLSAPVDRRWFAYTVARTPSSSREPSPPQSVVLRFWPMREQNYRELPLQWSTIRGMRVSPSGSFLGIIHGSPPGMLELIDLERSQAIARLPMGFARVGCALGWSNDERLLAIYGDDKCQVLNVPKLTVRNEIPIRHPCFVGFSPSGRFLALGSWQESVLIPVDYLDTLEKLKKAIA